MRCHLYWAVFLEVEAEVVEDLEEVIVAAEGLVDLEEAASAAADPVAAGKNYK